MAAPVSTVDLRSSTAAADLDTALRALGFVQVVGHGVDTAAGDDLWRALDGFFDLPLAVKQRLVVEDPVANRGYRGRGSESLSYSLGAASPPDLFESFNVGHDDRTGHPLLAPTPWPGDLPTFRTAVREWMAEMAALSARLDELIGRLIGVADLGDRSRRGPDTMACIRYRRHADEADPEAGQHRMGAHSDYTTFTVLRADPVPGLEILGPTGWIPVVPEPGALLVNVGDLLAIWTDDAWPSTVHRVPIRGDGTDPLLRRSAAYFHYPDLDVEVAPLPSWRRDGSEYRPVRVADHLAAKLVGPKRRTESGGASTLAGRAIEPG